MASPRSFSEAQERSIALSTARVNILEGATRGGKTLASLFRWFAYIADRNSPRGELAMVGRTRDTIGRNAVLQMQDPALFGSAAATVNYTLGAPVATIMGRRVHMFGANDVQAEAKIRGGTFAGMYGDELTLLPKAFFTQALGRLSVPGSKFFGTTNPGSSAHWLRADFLLRAGEPGMDLRVFHFTLEDNPSLDEGFKASIRAEYTGLFYRRFILGEWCAAEGAVFDMFDPDVHVVDIIPPVIQWIAVGIDVGSTNPTHAVLLGLGADSCLYVVSEYRHDSRQSHRTMSYVEYSQAIRGWLQQVPVPASRRPDGTWLRGVAPHYVIVDPSAASFRTQFHRDGLNTVAANNDVLDGIRTVSSLLAAGKLKVHRSCAALLAELPGYAWDEQAALKGEDKPLKVADHGIDALRYAVFTTRSVWQSAISLTSAA